MSRTDGAVVVRRTMSVPADRAWRELSDLRRHERWIPYTTVEAPPRLAVGDEVVAVSGPGRRRRPGVVDRMVVERVEPPETPADGPARTGVLALRKVGPLLLGPTEIRVRPLGERHCEVTWVEQVHLAGPDLAVWRRLTSLLLGPAFRAMLTIALTRATRDLTP